MEGESRKRKLESSPHEEENEEQKMERFFALIKSTRDARDHLFYNKDKKAEEDQQKGKGTWTPTFQPEDFIDYGELGKSNVSTTTQAGPSEKEEEEEKEKGKGKEVMIEKEYLQEASPAVVAPAQENHDPEEKEKEKEKERANDPLDLNLSL